MSLDISLMVNDQWKIVSKMGSGAAGDVYSAEDAHSGETVAVKVEHRGQSSLRKERDIYERLGCLNTSSRRAFGLPYIRFYGMYGLDHEALVMDCLGPSLETVQERSGQAMDQETASKIAIEGLDILQFVHSQGVVHCDIGPRNLLRSRNESESLYLVDFGLAETPGNCSVFEKLRIHDLKDLGKTLYVLRTGRDYAGTRCSSGVAPELDRYFEMIVTAEKRHAVNYRSLRGMFEEFLDV